MKLAWPELYEIGIVIRLDISKRHDVVQSFRKCREPRYTAMGNTVQWARYEAIVVYVLKAYLAICYRIVGKM